MAKETFYATFRLHFDPQNEADYKKRLADLTEAIRKLAVEVWWKDPTSYIMFWSESDLDKIALVLKPTINLKTDMVLIAMTAFQGARLIGYSPTEADLLKLMPFVKKA